MNWDAILSRFYRFSSTMGKFMDNYRMFLNFPVNGIEKSGLYGKRSLFNGILAILPGKHTFLRGGENQKV
jgi:hypothetical protein